MFPEYVISIHFNLPKTKNNPLKNVKGHYVLKNYDKAVDK